MASGPITSWQIEGETVADFIFGGSKITADGDCSHEISFQLAIIMPWINLIGYNTVTVQSLIAAMKLKDAYSLEGKLRPT